jgi:hypothetical protein
VNLVVVDAPHADLDVDPAGSGAAAGVAIVDDMA